MTTVRSFFLMAVAALTGSASAQFDPQNGQWLKDDGDLRVMSWNMEDAVVSTSLEKDDAIGRWPACVRIIAALEPDIIIIQEAGDRSGNGSQTSGTTGDSVAELVQAFELFINGGFDPVRQVQVLEYVTKFTSPGYELPYIFVSGVTDGFNRNVIISRYPFADLNGDGVDQTSTYTMIADAYQFGGSAGIRGFQFAEIDIPDEMFGGDLVIGNAHLKAGGSSSDFSDRLRAGQNAAYYIDYLFNGAGTGTSDPNGRILGPQPTSILDDLTALVVGGDLNENEFTNGRRGPAEWIAQAEFAGDTDGGDRDRSDMTIDTALDFAGNVGTLGGSKLDYLIWQDSIATATNQFVFDSAPIPQSLRPQIILDYPRNSFLISTDAADHNPVIVDLRLPEPVVVNPVGDLNCDGVVDGLDTAALCQAISDPAGYANAFPDCDISLADINGDEVIDEADSSAFCALIGQGEDCDPCGFFAPCSIADLDGNDIIDVFDLIAFLQNFDPNAACPGDAACDLADLDGNDTIDVFDLIAFLQAFDPNDPNCQG